jgi:hypothetical protein
MNIVLVSTYELGHQPFGLASPRAWLARAGHQVTSVDLAVETLPEAPVREAGMVAFYLPMHTATRLAMPVIERVRRLNPQARLVCYGLYAPINADLLSELGMEVLGGEFESSLVSLADGKSAPAMSLERLTFIAPDRGGMPDLARYAKLRQNGDFKIVGYTEASRGCKHLCRHCPVVPVYGGHFRVVGRDAVLEDIRRQASAGAQHITFGDPDFFNGPTHAMNIVEALHVEFPALTYDATIKIEHLLQHRDLLNRLKETGCLFVTSAVESAEDHVLEKLEKHHTRRDFLEAAALMREAGLTLQPTFIAFTPWTTLDGFRDLLRVLVDLDLVDHVAPVQLALRLLITSGSRLLELEDVRNVVGPFDSKALVYPWQHPDPEMDLLAERVFKLVQKQKTTRAETFASIWQLVEDQSLPQSFLTSPPKAVPLVLLRGAHRGAARTFVNRVLLVASKTGYQVREFYGAAERLGIELTLVTDRCHILEDPWGDQAAPVQFEQPDAGIDALEARGPFDGIIAVGDQPASIAAQIAERLKLRFHPAEAVRAAGDKYLTRERFRAAGMNVPTYGFGIPHHYPCVLKPLHLSASRGVIRANTPREFAEARARIRKMIGDETVLVEDFIPGREFAMEGIVTRGRLQTLAIFDKPDPLDGPFFEETIYLTPSRESAAIQQEIQAATQQAVRALGLTQGPVHAEMRVNEHGVWMLEAAARPIGGLCSRILRFAGPRGTNDRFLSSASGIVETGHTNRWPVLQSLEELLVQHALGRDVSTARLAPGAHGVMMIPIPGEGIYSGVDGVEKARQTADIESVEITAKEGQYLAPLPEGQSYLGFLFSRASSQDRVEHSLREAHACLKFRVTKTLPVVR